MGNTAKIMPFANYKHLHLRVRLDALNPGIKYGLEVQTNFNVDPNTSKTSTTYVPLECPGFIEALLQWVKRGQEFAGLSMEEFIDNLLTPEELAKLNGTPVATSTTNEADPK